MTTNLIIDGIATASDASLSLSTRIENKTAKVGVLGLGYVGLPLAVEFARAGFTVTGIDIQYEKVRQINAGCSYVKDVDQDELSSLVAAGRLRATTDLSSIADLDTIDICVPTPLRKTKDPDMSFVLAATEAVAEHIHPGLLVMLESTTYPGTTQELVLPRLQDSSYRVGEDFFLCFSPERVDPGNAMFKTSNIPKVIGGITPRCTEMGALFYRQALETVVPVSSTRVAEMVKLLENTFRMINIGLANEMALMCHRMGIDVWEVIDAAATKPFGFMPFYPGPGLGGHCIPVDPFYLSWKSKEAGIEAKFIDLAGQINREMPEFVVALAQEALNQACRSVRGSRIHLLGIAYKRDINDIRESPALDIMHLLMARGAQISYSDSHVPELIVNGQIFRHEEPTEAAGRADCVIIVTDHSDVNYSVIVSKAKLIVDTRNALKGLTSPTIIRL